MASVWLYATSAASHSTGPSNMNTSSTPAGGRNQFRRRPSLSSPTMSDPFNDAIGEDGDLAIMHSGLERLRKTVDEEQRARFTVKQTPQYKKLKYVADQAQELMDEMMDGIKDSSEKLAEAQKQFALELHKKGKTNFEHWNIVYKKAKAVNRDRLINVLGGDVDMYIKLSNVTQKSLKDHAKGNANEAELMECIEENQVVSDVEFREPPIERPVVPPRPASC